MVVGSVQGRKSGSLVVGCSSVLTPKKVPAYSAATFWGCQTLEPVATERNMSIPEQAARDTMTDESQATIEDDHRQIRALLSDLTATSDLSKMLGIVETLNTIFAAHFKREEEPNGFYAEIRQLRPEFDGKLKALERQHGVFLDKFKRLENNISRIAEDLSRVEESKAALIAAVDEHEQTETNLMLDAYYLDLGDSG
jgi:hypothetical protein